MSQREIPKTTRELFSEGVTSPQCGDVPIIQFSNKTDCFILTLPPNAEDKFRDKFRVQDDESILLARDTSMLNSRSEGLVITDRRIIYKPNDEASKHNSYSFDLVAFKRVTHCESALVFWSSKETSFPIPFRFFLKSRLKSYDLENACRQLGKLLEKIARSQTSEQNEPIQTMILNLGSLR